MISTGLKTNTESRESPRIHNKVILEEKLFLNNYNIFQKMYFIKAFTYYPVLHYIIIIIHNHLAQAYLHVGVALNKPTFSLRRKKYLISTPHLPWDI